MPQAYMPSAQHVYDVPPAHREQDWIPHEKDKTNARDHSLLHSSTEKLNTSRGEGASRSEKEYATRSEKDTVSRGEAISRSEKVTKETVPRNEKENTARSQSVSTASVLSKKEGSQAKQPATTKPPVLIDLNKTPDEEEIPGEEAMRDDPNGEPTRVQFALPTRKNSLTALEKSVDEEIQQPPLNAIRREVPAQVRVCCTISVGECSCCPCLS